MNMALQKLVACLHDKNLQEKASVMGKRELKRFYLCVVDSDNKGFSVEGPMSNDENWNQAVCKAQSAGRSVHCFSVHGQPDRTVIEKSYAAQSSFTAKQPGSVIVLHHLLD